MSEQRLLRVGREALWVASGQILAFLGGFAAIKFLTLQLGPAEYGKLALGISISGAVHMFLYGPLEQVALRFVSVYRERGQLGLLFSELMGFHRRAAVLVCVLIAAAGMAVLLLAGAGWGGITALGLLLGLAAGTSASVSAVQSAFRLRARVAVLQASDVWLRLLLAAAAIVWIDFSANAALAGFCMATAATALVQIAWAARRPEVLARPAQASGRMEDERRAELLAYGKPYIAFACFAWLSTYLDRWLILGYLDQQSVGVYAALFQIANAPIALFLGITNQFLVPLIFNRAGGGTAEQLRFSARLLNGAAVVYIFGLTIIVATAALISEPLVRLLTSAEFSRHASILWIICAGLSLSGTAQLLVIKGLAHGNPRLYVLPKFIQLVLLLAGIAVLVEPFRLTGIALSLCISGAGYLIAVMLANRRLHRLPA